MPKTVRTQSILKWGFLGPFLSLPHGTTTCFLVPVAPTFTNILAHPVRRGRVGVEHEQVLSNAAEGVVTRVAECEMIHISGALHFQGICKCGGALG